MMSNSFPSSTAQVKPLQNYSKDQTGSTVIPASKRPDGTWRKPIRVKEGFVPQEEIPVYQTKTQRTVAFDATAGPAVPVGYDPVVSDVPKEPSKAALKRQRAKAKKAQEQAASESSSSVDKTVDQLSKINLNAKKSK